MCVDLSNNDSYDGAKIHLWSKNGSDAQKWIMEESLTYGTDNYNPVKYKE